MTTFYRTIGKIALLSLLLSLASVTTYAATTYGPSASSPVIAPQVVQEAASQSTSLLAGRISQAVSNITGGGIIGGGGPQTAIIGGKGKAAGDPVNKTAIWMNIANSWVENDQSGVNYSGTILTGILGIDHQFTDSTLAGVAFGYENPNIDTTFNNGTFEGNNFSISPYVSYIINDNFNISGNVGYAFLDYETSRTNGAVTGDISGQRFFGDVSANSRFQLGGWNVQSGLGYMYLLEQQDSYSEKGAGGNTIDDTDIRIGQWRLSNKAGYPVEAEWGSFTPFGSVRLEYDSTKPDAGVADAFGTPIANDKFGATFGLGTDVAVGDDISLSIEGTTSQFRENLEVYSLSGTIRIKF